jgi:tetratricopeptide (TPR) repeat protein
MRALSGLWVCLLLGLAVCGCHGAVSPEGRRFLAEAQSAYQTGSDVRAIEASSGFLRLHPRVEEAGEAYYIRGLARVRAGQVEAGKADLCSALSLTRRKDLVALARAKLGDLAYGAGDLTEAEKQYRAVLEQVPPGAPPADQAMYRLGSILQRKGQWREADLLFRKVMYLFAGSELADRAGIRVGARRWSIQAGAFGAAGAEKLRQRLSGAGLDARIDLALRDGRLMRLVRVGSYPTYDAARADLGKVQKVIGEAFVTPAG